MDDGPQDIFDRTRRAARRDRRRSGTGYIDALIAQQLLERLDDVTRVFADVAVIGARNAVLLEALRARGFALASIEPAPRLAAATGAIPGQEDRLPLEPGSMDLILWPGGLEGVNDVPGALLRARLALRPDGLLLGCFAGDGSFPALRNALAAAEAARPAGRMHPQIPLSALGDLLQRVGLALSLVDVERVSLRYATLARLVGDLRDAALTNVLAGDVPPLSRAAWQRATAAFGSAGEDGRTTETMRIVHFSGWAPHASQPQPARRGSATASLAVALGSGATPQERG